MSLAHHSEAGISSPESHFSHEIEVTGSDVPRQSVGHGLRDPIESQYLRDLETLDRIERQREEADPCFFCAMGELAAARNGGRL